jgi:hypothetical protein
MAVAELSRVKQDRDRVERRSTYLALIGVFLSLFATFSTRLMRGAVARRRVGAESGAR